MEQDSYVLAAQAELDDLTKQSEAIEARRAKLQAFLAVLPTLKTKASGAAVPKAQHVAPASINQSGNQPDSRAPRNQVIAAAREALAGGKRLNSWQLVTILTEKGLVLGEDPEKRRQRISALLSSDKSFIPDRTAGWGLAMDFSGAKTVAEQPLHA